MPPDKGKGKAKARSPEHSRAPTERDPLIASSSRITEDAPDTVRPIRRSRLGSILFTAGIVAFSLFLSALLFVALLAYSFKPSESEVQSLPKTAFAYSLPESIQVLNITEDGIRLNVSLRCGIDFDRALGISPISEQDRVHAQDDSIRGIGAEWWEKIRRWTGHTLYKQLESRVVQVSLNDHILVLPEKAGNSPLLQVTVPEPLDIPLLSGRRQGGKDTLPLMWVQILAKPVAGMGDLLSAARKAWEEGEVRVRVQTKTAHVALPEKAWWAKYGTMVKEDISMNLDIDVPDLGIPNNGNLSTLVHLDRYDLLSLPTGLAIIANASMPNLFSNLTRKAVTTKVPFSLPFSVALSDGSVMAEVITAPIYIDKSDKISLGLSGEITADLDDTGDDSPLSTFLQKYLNGEDNPIKVKGLTAIPSFIPPSSIDAPPNWLLHSMQAIQADLIFPGPKPKPNILKSVTIERVRIVERRGKMLVSGMVLAIVELPPAMERVNVDVSDLLPDILVYNGPVEDDDDGDGEEYPPRAFGRIRPEDWLPAATEHLTDDPVNPYKMQVTAEIQEVPLEVLSGRDKVLSDFVSKIVFRGGAEAGIKGTADVKVQIQGVGKGKERSLVRLDGLPVQGRFWVGRQRLAGSEEFKENSGEL